MCQTHVTSFTVEGTVVEGGKLRQPDSGTDLQLLWAHLLEVCCGILYLICYLRQLPEHCFWFSGWNPKFGLHHFCSLELGQSYLFPLGN